MKSQKPYFSSQIFIRLVLSTLILSSALVGLGYLLLQKQHQIHIEQRHKHEFGMIVKGLNRHIIHSGNISQNILDEHSTIHADHRLILFSPSGTSLFSQFTGNKKTSDADFSLPQFKTENANAIHIIDENLTAWQDLENNYRLYAQIKLPRTHFWEANQGSIYWWLILIAPVIMVLLLLITFSIIYQRFYKGWLQIVHYTNNIEKQLHYEPIKTNSIKELASFETLINRIAFRFGKQKESIQLLTQTKKQLIDNLPDIVFRTNRNNKIVYANTNFLHAFNMGLPTSINKKHQLPDELYLHSIIQGVSRDDQMALSKLVDEPAPLRVLVKDNNSNRKYDLWINPIYHANDTGDLPIATGFVGILHNVSRDQNQLSKLSSKQLEINERLKANEQLWAVIGHELRTPLNGMIGMIQLLHETALDEEQTDFVKTLKSSSDNLLFLLNDMLDLSKLDAGKMETVVSDMDLLSLSREVCELMSGNASRKSLEILSFADPDTPRFVPGDMFRIRQVLLNLMGNAIKFTQKGHVALLLEQVPNDHEPIRKRFLGGDDKKQWIRFSISDTGPGIPDDEQQKLFMFFNQANSSISRRFGGTGLGLAISKGLAEMMGGFITLRSKTGLGTTFELYLPFEIENKSPMYTYPRINKALNLVVFDSNALNHTYLSKLLGSVGIPITMFNTFSLEQVKKLTSRDEGEQAPILVIDYDMLIKDDLKNLLTSKRFSSLKKLLMSNRGQRSLPPRVLELFDGFISKPIFIENFLAEVLRVSEVDETFKPQPVDSQLLDNMLIEIKEAQERIEIQSNHTKMAEPESVATTKTKNSQAPILLAEDNKINQKVAVKMLEKLGYYVIVAENGEECLEKLTENPNTKMIFMDCRMPKMDGLTATRKIREKKISIPIIALTANDTEEDRDACEAAGMDEFLAKPINQEKLSKLLKHYKPLFE